MVGGIFINKNCKELQSKISLLQSETTIAVRLLKSIESQDWNPIREFSNEQKSDILDVVKSLGASMEALMIKEHEQLWKANTLADFSSVFQGNGDNLEVLSRASLSKTVKTMGAGLGLIYVTEEKDERIILKLKASYAASKNSDSEIEIGDGLIGQCFVDKKRMLLTNIPKNFINISSSMGSALPRCVLLQPLQSNGRSVGVIELASFKMFTPIQLEFIERVSENIASEIVSVKESERIKGLLEESEKMAKELRLRDQQQKQRTLELEVAHAEIENQKKEIKEILERESELVESKIRTHRELTDVIINKLKSKVSDMEKQLMAAKPMTISYAG